MKYLDILKEYDNAIISESKKLQDIYNKLIKEEENKCNKCDDGCCDGSCVKEEQDKNEKVMTDFVTEKEKMVSKKDFFEQEKPVTQETNPVEKPEDKTTKPTVEPEEQITEPTEEIEEDEEEEEDNKETEEEEEEKDNKETEEEEEEEEKETTNGPEDDAVAVSAQDLFGGDEADEKQEQDDEEKAKQKDKKQSEKKVEEDDMLKDRFHNGHVSVDEAEIKTAKDWIGDVKESCKKEDIEVVKEEKCEECGEEPCICGDEEAQEQKQLKESIEAIRAFTMANKRLFIKD